MAQNQTKESIGRKAHRKGYAVEGLAVIWLCLKGYRIIARNFITGKGSGAGEIDIIAAKGNTLAFIEVKSRKSIDDAAYAISDVSKKRIAKAAEFFLALHSEYNHYDVRFDAFLAGGKSYPVHIKDAWRNDWW
ncbi:MAG: YraN family protein [Alphaproteobacteria bacterium]|nr:YraN family protein [Alphaproteobacteria bacterium]